MADGDGGCKRIMEPDGGRMHHCDRCGMRLLLTFWRSIFFYDSARCDPAGDAPHLVVQKGWTKDGKYVVFDIRLKKIYPQRTLRHPDHGRVARLRSRYINHVRRHTSISHQTYTS